MLPTEHEHDNVEAESLLERLQEINIAAKAGSQLEELKELIQKVYSEYTFTQVIPVFPPGGLTVYRARKMNRRPVTVAEISYPKGRSGNWGRLNVPGASMFYASLASAGACLYECGAQIGDRYAVGVWTNTRTLALQHMGYLAKDDSEVWKARLSFHFQDAPKRLIDRVLGRWQSEVFTKESARGATADYVLSNALAQFALSAVGEGRDLPDHFAGIMYPSVASNLLGDNIALRPGDVDSSLVLIEAKLEEIVSTVTSIDYLLHRRERTVSHESRMIWTGRPDVRSGRFLTEVTDIVILGRDELLKGRALGVRDYFEVWRK